MAVYIIRDPPWAAQVFIAQFKPEKEEAFVGSRAPSTSSVSSGVSKDTSDKLNVITALSNMSRGLHEGLVKPQDALCATAVESSIMTHHWAI